MNIVKINIYKHERPLRVEFHSSLASRTNIDSIIVRLEFENGISGYGESTPKEYVTGETNFTVIETIKNYFSPILFSYEVNSKDDIELLLDKLEEECLTQNIHLYNSALGAIDIAMLDALGKHKGLSITSLLGSIVREKAPYTISIPFLPLQKIEALFYQLPKSEVKYVKVLVGTDEKENVERVAFIRSLCGENVDIRVENNGIWTFKQALSNLEKLAHYNISAVEQPLAKDNIDGLKRLKTSIEMPIIVDESMCSLSDAKDLIQKKACDILNIKISKCGGLLRSRRIAEFAQLHNILCQMGAHVGETEILRAAGKSFALSTSNLLFFEGASFLLFEDEWRNNQFEIQHRDQGSGFGLEIESAHHQSIMNRCTPIAELNTQRTASPPGARQ
jgi:L-alanine-DL-glutamate epimerase-like enolase superfamily enzyme